MSSDASFVSHADMTFQLRFVIGLMDKNNFAIVVHYSSFKARCIISSMLAADLFVLVHAVDFILTMQKLILEL